MIFKFIAVLIVLIFVACGPSDDIKAQCTIEFNGDSIMSNDVIADSIPKVFARLRPAYIVDDRGIIGLSLNSLLNGYSAVWVGGPLGKLGVQKPYAQEPHPSKYIVIELGGNDAYGGQSAQQFETQLRTLLKIIQSQNKVVIVTDIVQVSVVGIFTPEVVDRIAVFRSITKKVADELQVVNMRWDTVDYNGLQDTVDGVHRTQEASNRLVMRTIEVMDRIAPGCLK